MVEIRVVAKSINQRTGELSFCMLNNGKVWMNGCGDPEAREQFLRERKQELNRWFGINPEEVEHE